MDMLIKIAVSLGMKLLTESVIAKVVCASLEEAAKRTTNQLDDQIVEAVKKAWGQN